MFVHKGAGSGGGELVFEVLSKADLLWIAGYPTGVQLKSYILLSKGREEGWRNAGSIQSPFILVSCGMLSRAPLFTLQAESGRMGN